MLNLYDTATREVRELALREPGKVGIYLCGPTVYGPPHVGHGRATLEYDVLVRYLRWCGLDVQFVSNVTDIDDKIINRANDETRPWEDIAAKCESVWWKAMDGIGNVRPDDIPHATAYVAEMVEMIGQLIEIGRAYPTDDGVYLSVETVEDYGLLAHQSLDDMLAGGGEREVFGAESKKHPADFVLWKLAKPGEPAWPSPWGAGRPGWHSECVVMSLGLLGEGFDLHAGGQDLRFPHHENERAQAVALGKRFANHWMHHGMVVDASGEKMSKSLGNYDNLLDLLERYDGRVYRMVLLQSHYRQPVKVGGGVLDAAAKTIAGLDAFAARTAGGAGGAGRRGRARSLPGGDGRRPRHAQGDGAAVRHGAAGQHPARRRRRRCGGAARRCRPGDRASPSASSSGAPSTSPTTWPPVPSPSTRHAPPRTTPPPTRSVPASRPTAGSSRRPPPAPSCGGEGRASRPPGARAPAAARPGSSVRSAIWACSVSEAGTDDAQNVRGGRAATPQPSRACRRCRRWATSRRSTACGRCR